MAVTVDGSECGDGGPLFKVVEVVLGAVVLMTVRCVGSVGHVGQ